MYFYCKTFVRLLFLVLNLCRRILPRRRLQRVAILGTMIRITRKIPASEIKLLIFDLDGTLIDSERDLAASVNAMLVHYGRKELPLEVIGTYIGDGPPMLIPRALGDPSDRDFLQEALNYFLSHYREHKLDSTYVYEGIQEALRRIENFDGWKRQLAVLTNKPV